MSLQWSEELSVGVEAIDAQHKELINRINGLLQAMSQGKGREEIGGLLEFLGRYVVEHFGVEEDYMSRFSYPGLVAHRAQHAAFVNDFEALRREFITHGASAHMTLQVQRRICDWLKTHIAGTDKLLGTFLKTKL